MSRSLRAVAGLSVLCFMAACQGVHRPPIDAPRVAVYRARVEAVEPASRKSFRLWVYASAPDRLHAELLSGFGTTELVIDAGGGRISILFVRERIAFVGASDRDSLQALTGFPIGSEALVSALLGAEPDADSGLVWEISRFSQGYPTWIRVAHSGSALELTLKRVRELRGVEGELGTGAAPAGVELRPLSALAGERLPGVDDAVTGD